MSKRRGLLAPIDVEGLLSARNRGLLDDPATDRMSVYRPTLRDRIGNMAYDMATASGMSRTANRMRADIRQLMDFVPGIGEAMGAEETGQALGAGRYGDAAINGTATAAGILPVGGDAVGGLLKAIFAGVGAKTADKAAAKAAQQMAADGIDKADIWKQTGWFKGVDGKWRFEIDDRLAHTKGAAPMSDIVAKRGDSVSDVVWHPELFKAYPELAEARARGFGGNPNMRGSFQVGDPLDDDPRSILSINDNLVGHEQKSTTLHELQHPIQVAEDFARGAHPSEYASGAMFHQNARSLQGALSQALTGGLGFRPREIIDNIQFVDPAKVAEIARAHGFSSADEALAFLKKQDEMRSPMSQYRRTAGEVEARNVQTRMNMTPEQRRATPPWVTQDVPDAEQIVRRR